MAKIDYSKVSQQMSLPKFPEGTTEAFITGSYRYGTPTPESDIDLVILVNQDTYNVLYSQAHTFLDEKEYMGFCAYFGNLNLIVLFDYELYQVWKEGSADLEKKRPVTREYAIAYLSQLRRLYYENKDTQKNKP